MYQRSLFFLRYLCTCITFAIIAFVVLSFCAVPALADSRSPNVIVFLSDDQGWGDFSFQGNTNLKTPHIDSLAQRGALLERFYVCPVCAPTRAELLTGRYHPRSGAMGVTEGKERLDLDETLLAERFLKVGYATAAFGKWHNGTQYPYHPNARGFQEFYGFTAGHWGDYFSPPLDHNGQSVTGNGYVTDDFTSHAIEFIRSHKEDPFFCYVAYNTPHSPMQVPDAYFNRLEDRPLSMKHQGRPAEKEDEAMTRAALAMVENIDDNVGRILNVLESEKLMEDTIIVYFNDNGPNSFRWNGGMKGRKGSVDDGGTRSPCLIQWPKKIPAGLRTQQLSGAIDLTPTLCALAGINVDNSSFDGLDLSSQLLSKQEPLVKRQLFTHWAGRIALREGDVMLDQEGKLFDLVKDPTQKSVLNDEFPEVVERMRGDVERWEREVVSPAKVDARPFTVGDSRVRRTELPARDGTGKGPTIKRSAAAPNCSYFTDWKSLDDRVQWSIEVLEEGEYEILMQYNAPESSVGSVIEVTYGELVLQVEIKEPFVAVPYGAEKDRVERHGESLMKPFKWMSLGRCHLKPSKGECSLKLTEVKGTAGLEIQGIEFIRAR
jgi:arylsulfatase A-like enzyme